MSNDLIEQNNNEAQETALDILETTSSTGVEITIKAVDDGPNSSPVIKTLKVFGVTLTGIFEGFEIFDAIVNNPDDVGVQIAGAGASIGGGFVGGAVVSGGLAMFASFPVWGTILLSAGGAYALGNALEKFVENALRGDDNEHQIGDMGFSSGVERTQAGLQLADEILISGLIDTHNYKIAA